MIKKIILGTLAYTIITFIIAIMWHIVLFKDRYLAFGYFKGEPNMLIGFLTILIQGIILTYLYNFFLFTGSNLVKSMRYVLIVGLFFWTSHVLALVAKQNVENATQFILMESFYLAIQFGVFGICLAIIHKKKEKQLFNS
jgi:hypothetical protein